MPNGNFCYDFSDIRFPRAEGHRGPSGRLRPPPRPDCRVSVCHADTHPPGCRRAPSGAAWTGRGPGPTVEVAGAGRTGSHAATNHLSPRPASVHEARAAVSQVPEEVSEGARPACGGLRARPPGRPSQRGRHGPSAPRPPHGHTCFFGDHSKQEYRVATDTSREKSRPCVSQRKAHLQGADQSERTSSIQRKEGERECSVFRGPDHALGGSLPNRAGRSVGHGQAWSKGSREGVLSPQYVVC